MKWIKVTTILTTLHLTIFIVVWALQDSIDLKMVNDIVLGSSIYLPLMLWDAIGIRVTQGNGAMLPPPNIIGWFLCILSWLLIYVAIGYITSKIGKGNAS